MNHPALEPERLIEITGASPDLMKRFFDLFDSTYATTIADMRTALAASDFDALAKLAHTIKGAAANLHAVQMRESAHTVEIHARESNTDAIAADLNQLDDDYTAFTQAARALLGTLG